MIHVVYVRSIRSYVAIAQDGDTIEVCPAERRKIDPPAKVLYALGIKTGAGCTVKDDLLYIDGLALIDIWFWAYDTAISKSPRSVARKFYAAFDGDDSVTATLHAVARVIFKQEHTASGESAFFCAEQWRQHPERFAQLRSFCGSHVAHNLRNGR